MWLVPLRDKLGADQWDAWNDIQRAAFDLVRDGGPDDPWLFHGTTAILAGWVLRDGFCPNAIQGSMERGLSGYAGVHWGHPAVAASFAVRFAASDNPPVMFAARASSIAASTTDGVLRPDFFACASCGCPRSYPEGFDQDRDHAPVYGLGQEASCDGLPESEDGGLHVDTWQQSLALSGAVTAQDGRHVTELALLDIPADLPLHASASQNRAERLADTPQEWRRRYAAFIAPGMEGSIDPRSVQGARKVLGLADIASASLAPAFGR